MPVCFQLYDKTKPGEGPVVLQEIDRLMCEHLEQPCDPMKYLNEWYTVIGFRLVCGKTFEEIRAQFNEYVAEDTAKGDLDAAKFFEDSLKILEWLDEHYSPNSFYAPKTLLEGY